MIAYLRLQVERLISYILKIIEERLLVRLRTAKLIRWQLAVYLYFVRIYHITRDNYAKNNRKFELLAGGQQFEQKCRPFPRAHSGWFYYDHVSNCWLLLAIVKYTFPQAAASLAGQLARLCFQWQPFGLSSGHNETPTQEEKHQLSGGELAMPAHCYLPGRFVMHDAVRREFAATVAFMNLCFRFISRLLARPLDFSMINFLLQSQGQLEAYYESLEESELAHRDAKGLQTVYNVPAKLKWHPFNRFLCFPITRADLQQGSCLRWSARAPRPRPTPSRAPAGRHSAFEAGSHERQTVAPALPPAESIDYFRLRSNRTSHAHRLLTARVASTTLFVTTVFVYLFTIVAPLLTAMIVLDKGYLYNYPKCDAQLERMNERGELAWISFTLTRHRLVMALFDGLENFFIWFDSALSITYVFALPYLLDFDVTLCWRLLHERIEAQSTQARTLGSAARELPTEPSTNGASSYTSPPIVLFRHGTLLGALSQQITRPAGRCGLESAGHPRGTRNLAEQQHADSNQVDRALHALRCELSDFFEQLNEADLLISDFISIGIVYWLLSVSVICHQAIRYYLEHPAFLQDMGIPLSFQSFVSLGLAVASIPTSFISIRLFQLHTKCRRAYEQLCSIVADPRASPQVRARFSRDMMEYFVHQDRISYRMFQTYPFRATTYLSLITWTASLLSVLSNLVDFSSS